jgi:hypothetical protein
VFSILGPYNEHKLQLCSFPCIFLGYALSQKDYKCIDLSTQRVFIFIHFQFHEIHIPFKTPASIQTPDSAAHSNYNNQLLLDSFPSLPPCPISHQQTAPSQAQQLPSSPNSLLGPSSPVSPNPTYHTNSPARNSNSPAPANTSPSSATPPSHTYDHPISTPSNIPPQPDALTPQNNIISASSTHHMTTRTRDHTRKPRQFTDHITYLSTSSLD